MDTGKIIVTIHIPDVVSKSRNIWGVDTLLTRANQAAKPAGDSPWKIRKSHGNGRLLQNAYPGLTQGNPAPTSRFSPPIAGFQEMDQAKVGFRPPGKMLGFSEANQLPIRTWLECRST